MAWKQVIVKIGKDKYESMMDDNEFIEMPNAVDIGSVLNVDGKDLKVLSSSVILSGDMLRIHVAGATSKQEKSDDGSKQAEG